MRDVAKAVAVQYTDRVTSAMCAMRAPITFKHPDSWLGTLYLAWDCLDAPQLIPSGCSERVLLLEIDPSQYVDRETGRTF